MIVTMEQDSLLIFSVCPKSLPVDVIPVKAGIQYAEKPGWQATSLSLRGPDRGPE
jgi:hypothetical protein